MTAERPPSSNYLVTFMAGSIVGLCLSVFVLKPDPMSLEEMQTRAAAYRECMQQAGSQRCHMDPEHFVDLYELEARIRVASSSQ